VDNDAWRAMHQWDKADVDDRGQAMVGCQCIGRQRQAGSVNSELETFQFLISTVEGGMTVQKLFFLELSKSKR